MPDVRLVTATELPVPDTDMPLVVAALRDRGVHVAVDDWRDASVDWSDARVTVLRSPWDYVDHLAEFLAWVDRVDTVTNLWNPAAVLRWNTHKSYLLDLGARGAPVVPTVMLTHGGAAALDGIADAQGWNALVVKPAVGVGGEGAGRFDVGDPAGQDHLDDLLARGDVLVQQFAPAIVSEGECSVVVFDGVVSHALRKQAAPGEFRIHEEHGGRTDACTPTAGQVELAERLWRALPAPSLYARMDMVQIGGQWHVLEVEATEPALFLDRVPPAATDRLADAVKSRLSRLS
jgi:glutathione synthase/RimK-type ligase-like ATP-grasp enzyme